MTDTSTISALKNTSFSFTDIPLNIELIVTALFKTDEDVFFEGKSEPFTLTSTSTKQVAVQLEKLFSTPCLLWNLSNHQYAYSKAAAPLSSSTELSGLSSKVTNFCWDDDETLWYLEGSSLKKLEKGSETPESIESEVSFRDIDYDYKTQKFFLLYYSNNAYHLCVADSNAMKTAEALDSTNTDNVELMLVVGDQGSEKTDISGAVENGIYYSVYSCGDLWGLQCNTYIPGGVTAYPKVTYNLSSQSLLTMWGGKITPLSNDSIIQSDFIVYKDIQVMNDSVYLLAQQRRYLVENNSIPETTDKNQFFSRGAVLCFDSFNAGANDPAVIGFTEAVPEKGKDSQVLLGPQKFLAINPKKLVIADCGIVYYTDSNGLPKTEKQSRIATVDLESFAITSIGYDKNFGNCQINGSDYYTFSYYRNTGTSFGLFTELTGPTNGSAVSVSKYSFTLSYGLD